VVENAISAVHINMHLSTNNLVERCLKLILVPTEAKRPM
jgi:hypothetical protein